MNNIGDQSFHKDAQFKIKVKKDSKGESTIVFKTKESLQSEEQSTLVGKVVMRTLRTLGFALFSKEVRSDWKIAVTGEKKKYVQFNKSFVPDEVINKKGTVSLNEVKSVSERMDVKKKIKEEKEDFEIHPLLNEIIEGKEKFNGYEVCQRKDETGQSRHFLVKSFDDIEAFKTDDELIEKGQKMTLEAALTEVSKEEPSVIKVEQVEINALEKVTDPGQIVVAEKSMTCSNGKKQFQIDTAVAMRKGPEKLTTPKAMGEDAFVIDQISLTVAGKQYEIPLMATLDGGGGHALAQYGQKHIKNTFQKHLTLFATQNGKIDAFTISAAMRATDEELFSFPDPKGSAYVELQANHDKVQTDLKISANDLKAIVQNFKSDEKKLNLNPMEMHQAIQKGDVDENFKVTVGKRTFNLKEKPDAEALQYYYELCLGTPGQITVQMVMNAFLVNDENRLECITYNRGDSMAIHLGTNGAEALSKRVTAVKTNRSKVSINDGEGVLSACDGVTDTTSVKQLEKAHTQLKDLSALDYATKMMRASILTGSGDDKTMIYAKARAL